MHILIIEDHAIVRDACTALVLECFPSAQITAVATLSAAGALQSSVVPLFDLVLLDLVIPKECSGINTVDRFRIIYPTVPVIAMSGLDPESVIPGLFQAGVSAYVPKSAEPEAFRAALLATVQGKRFIPEEYAHLLDTETSNPIPRLNARQMQILACLGQGKPDKRIARDLNISEDTVAYHMKSIFSALNANSRAQAVSKGFQTGLLTFM
jgi:two-component system, NarL family, nitrate/nitrite response regulator NarL